MFYQASLFIQIKWAVLAALFKHLWVLSISIETNQSLKSQNLPIPMLIFIAIFQLKIMRN